MTNQSHLSDIDSQIQEATKALRLANEKKAALEKAALEKARLDQLERQLTLDRERQKQLEEERRKIEARNEIMRQREAAEDKARRDAEEENRRLEEQADRLRIRQQEREASERKLREIEQELFQQEQEAKRIEADLQRASQPAPEPEQPKTLADGPLAMIFGGRTVEPVTVQAAPASPLKKLNLPYTSADVEEVLHTWPAFNRPETFEIQQLLKEFSAKAIVEAVKTLMNSWQNSGQQPNYCLEQTRQRLQALEKELSQ
jgi:ribonucleotide reductase alpha subunit